MGLLAGLACCLQVTGAHAQTSIDVLEQDLKRIKEDRASNSSQVMVGFYSALDPATNNAQAAMDLYQKAGGPVPKGADVVTRYEHETPDEQAAREASDSSAMQGYDGVVQLHCGLMRFAAMQIKSPETPHLSEDWIAWLKNAAQLYPQVAAHEFKITPEASTIPGGPPSTTPPAPISSGAGGRDFRYTPLRDSPISNYLNFHGWGSSEQAGWSVSDLPRLYRQFVLDPLRTTKSPNLIPAWDTYLAMRQATEGQSDRWASETAPALQFERANDAWTVSPTVENVGAMVDIIKANPTHAQVDDWTAKVQTILDMMKAASTPAPVASNPDAPHADAPQPDAPTPPAH